MCVGVVADDTAHLEGLVGREPSNDIRINDRRLRSAQLRASNIAEAASARRRGGDETRC
jgi:hypothetical protein